MWLQIWTDLGRAPRTIDAYACGLAEYLVMCEREDVDPVTANCARRGRRTLAALRPRTRLLQLHLLRCQHRMGLRTLRLLHPKGIHVIPTPRSQKQLAEDGRVHPAHRDERAAVDDGQAALNRLLERLADVPTPAGPTPRELSLPPGAVALPIVETDALARDSTRRRAVRPSH